MSIQQVAEPVLRKLLGADETTLLEQLGMGRKALESPSPVSMQFGATFTYDGAIMGPMDEVKELGRRLLARWSRELYKVMCGDAQADAKDRESLLNALGLGDVAVGAAITAFLCSVGIASALAVIIAALIVKRIITPGGQTVCQYWGEQLKDK